MLEEDVHAGYLSNFIGLTCESLTLSYVRRYPGSTPGSLLISSRAISAAGITPEELNPDWPKETTSMMFRSYSSFTELT